MTHTSCVCLLTQHTVLNMSCSSTFINPLLNLNDNKCYTMNAWAQRNAPQRHVIILHRIPPHHLSVTLRTTLTVMCVVAPAVLKRRLKLQQQASKRLLASQPAHVLKAAAQASPAFSSLEGDTVAAVEASPAFSSFTSRGKGPLLFGDGVLTDRS